MEITEKELRRIVRTEVRKALQEVFPIRVLDLTDSDKREIWDRVASTIPVHAAVMPVQMFDNTDGKVKNFGTWAQPQTFNNTVQFNDDITLAQGKKILLGDGDSFINESTDDNIHFFVIDGISKLVVGRYAVWYTTQIIMNGNNIGDIGFAKFDEITTPSATAAHVKVYAKEKGATNSLYFKTDDGTEHEVASV
jgi:hypothetical protein